MKLGGYANHVARIDLGSGAVNYEGINEEDARLYIGARGLGDKYLYDNGPAIDPKPARRTCSRSSMDHSPVRRRP